MNRYFKDFEVVQEPRKNGKGTKRNLVYVGPHYEWKLTEEERKKRTILFSVISLICAVAHIIGILVAVPSNTQTYVGVPGALAVVPLFFMVLGSLNGFTVKGEMERAKYRGTAKYRRYGSFIFGIFLLYCAIALPVYLFHGHGMEQMTMEIVLECAYVLELVLCVWFYMMERNQIYEEKEGARKKGILRKSRL